MARTALLLGSTGLVGSHCLSHLLASSSYDRVITLVRRATDNNNKNKKLEERVVDFDALDEPISDSIDDFYCAVGSTMKKAGSKEAFRKIDYDLPLNVLNKACTNKPARIALVSSVGADSSAGNFYLRTKGELEDALAKIDGVKALHILRPSFLVGDRSESRPGERFGIAIAKATSGLLLGGLRKYRPITVEDVGKALVAAALSTAVTGRKTYEFDAILDLAKSL
jgi:uncharacterized protein YbjT (DUF2867 family)